MWRKSAKRASLDEVATPNDGADREHARGMRGLGFQLKSALFLHFSLNAGHIVGDFVDRFLDRLDVGMDFSENRVLLFRNVFDSFGLFS